MADIVTNTLQIGNDNLILRDADAQEKVTGLKEDLTPSIDDLKGAFAPVRSAVMFTETAYPTTLGTGFLTSNGVYSSSTFWKITVLPVTPGEVYDITAYFNAITTSQNAKSMYSILDTEATAQNYTTIEASHVLSVGGIHGGTYGEITDGNQTETSIVIPANAVCMLVSCTNINTKIKPSVSKVAYISSAELVNNIDELNDVTNELSRGVAITWNAGKALSTAGTLVDFEGYSASNLIHLTEIVKGATFENIRQRISYTIVPICFYDASGAFIGYYTDADAGNNAAITVTIADILDDYTGATQIRIGKSDSDNVVVDSPSLESLSNKVTSLEEVYPPYNVSAYPHILCCGDSVTYGFVVEGTQNTPSQIYAGIPAQSYPSCIGRIIGNDITTKAQSGITVKQFYETLYPTITWTDYNMAIFELGLNPGNEGYLSMNDINTPGKSAYIYRQMIASIRSAAPNLTIVLMRSAAHMASGQAVLEYIANESDCLVINLADSKYINLNDQKYHGWFDNNGTPTFDDTHFTRIGYAAKAYDVLRWLGVLLPD